MPKYFREVNKHFSGDKEKAASYMGVARSLLGGLVEMSGDLFQNARKVVLKDGTRITVSFAGAIANVLIDVRKAEKLLLSYVRVIPAIYSAWLDDAIGDDPVSTKLVEYRNCSTTLIRTKKNITGAIDWIDATGMPKMWVEGGYPVGWARYSLMTSTRISRDVYLYDGSVITVPFSVSGFTIFKGINVFASRVDNTFSVRLEDGTIIASFDTTPYLYSGLLSDTWVKFNQSGDAGVVLLSTKKYLLVELHKSGSVITATFTVQNTPDTYTSSEASPQIFSPGPPGHCGYGLMEGYGYRTDVVAIDYYQNEIVYLYCDVGNEFWNIHWRDVPGDEPVSEYRGVSVGFTRYRVGGSAIATESLFVNTNNLLHARNIYYDYQLYPGDVDHQYSVFFLSDLDLRRKAAAFDGRTIRQGWDTLTSWDRTRMSYDGQSADIDGPSETISITPIPGPSVFDEPWYQGQDGEWPNCITMEYRVTRTITDTRYVDLFSVGTRDNVSSIFCFSNEDAIGFINKQDGNTYKQHRFCANSAASDVTSNIGLQSGYRPDNYGYIVVEYQEYKEQ